MAGFIVESFNVLYLFPDNQSAENFAQRQWQYILDWNMPHPKPRPVAVTSWPRFVPPPEGKDYFGREMVEPGPGQDSCRRIDRAVRRWWRSYWEWNEHRL